MELIKTLNSIKTLEEKIKTAYLKDLDMIIEKLSQDFDIYERGTDTRVHKKELMDSILTMACKTQLCCAVTKNGNRCSRKALDDCNYCGIHVYSEQNLKLIHNNNKINSKNNSDIFDNFHLFVVEREREREQGNNDQREPEGMFKKVLIDDAFYLTDNKWVYDKVTNMKVGYVSKSEENYNYILTDDPFILQEIH